MKTICFLCFAICLFDSSKVFSQNAPKSTGDSQLRSLININGTLYFAAKDSSHGVELWKSNGTAAGTVMVKDIYPGSTGSTPSSFINVNGALYFTANNGSNGIELWKSDGTPSGTQLVRDIYPGSGSSAPSSLVNLNGVLFFSANDSIHSNELWKSDGTKGGTTLVKDINLEPNDVGLYNKLQVNKISGIYGDQELLPTIGTGSSTVELVIVPGKQTGTPRRQLARTPTQTKRTLSSDSK
jgi:ELWxxDGT repeat protein